MARRRTNRPLSLSRSIRTTRAPARNRSSDRPPSRRLDKRNVLAPASSVRSCYLGFDHCLLPRAWLHVSTFREFPNCGSSPNHRITPAVYVGARPRSFSDPRTTSTLLTRARPLSLPRSRSRFLSRHEHGISSPRARLTPHGSRLAPILIHDHAHDFPSRTRYFPPASHDHGFWFHTFTPYRITVFFRTTLTTLIPTARQNRIAAGRVVALWLGSFGGGINDGESQYGTN